MKVNISGRGIIPGLNRLAPVRNVDLPQKDILRLLNYRQFKLYSSETGLLITKTNVTDLFKPVVKKVVPVTVEPVIESTPVVEVKTETIPEVENQTIGISMEPIEETNEIKPQFLAVTEIPTIDEVVESEPIEEEIVTQTEDQITEEIVAPVEDVVEKKSERPYYSKKKNRKR